MHRNYIGLQYLLLFIFLLFSASLAAQDIKLASYRPLKVTNRLVSFGHRKGDENRKVDVVIVHSTYNAADKDSFSINGVVDQFRQYNVSAHYVIDRNGTIHQLVEEKDISFHAGKGSLPDGRTDINPCSIGIEIVNTTASGPTPQQYEALMRLVKDIKSRHNIKYVLGHSDIAPNRKSDPWKFDWIRFNGMMK